MENPEKSIKRKKIKKKRPEGERVAIPVKKKKFKIRKKAAITQPELPFEEAPQDIQPTQQPSILRDALENLTLRGRAYRLSMGTMGRIRTLTDVERASIMKEDNQSVSSSKRLYHRDDPYIKNLNDSQANLREYFHRLTIAHPDAGVRLFVMRETDKRWADMSPEELQEAMARQLDTFHTDMHAAIDRYKEGPVAALVDNYDTILKSAEEWLGDLFDVTQYPDRGALVEQLYVKFHPIPSVLPPEYNRIDPEMRQRVTMYVREQLESSLALQLKTVEEALMESLNGLKERIEGINDPGQRFYQSRIRNVTDAIDQYNTTMRSLGVELGSDLTRTLTTLRRTIDGAGANPNNVIESIRKNDSVRTSMLESVQDAISRASNTLSPISRQIG